MSEVRGNLNGIRDSVIKQLKSLYDVPPESSQFLSMEMAALLAELTALIRREISVFLARNGQVLDVSVGLGDSVSLQDFGQRRSEHRLSRVRCIHTHPNGDETLSDVDLSALVQLRLDAMCALGVDASGRLTGASLSFLSPNLEGELRAGPIRYLQIEALDNPSLMETIAGNDLMATQQDMYTAEKTELVYLVSADSQQTLDELQSLAEAAGAEVVGSTLQEKSRPDPGTYIGSGKASQVSLAAQAAHADLIIVDDELTGMQNLRLEELVGLPVIDRTSLILDIFAQRATSSEGKLQVNLAQLNYKASRLVGSRAWMSRLAGGIGTRGPGETKLEMDRRTIRHRIHLLKNELKELDRQRDIRRKMRQSSEVQSVALVGYTNTGKSTLLNRLSGSDVLVKDQLFATLDTVSRKVTLKDGDQFLLTDSVGFVSKLPTDLVAAFKSTLDEALGADILIIVSDASSHLAAQQRQVVEEVLGSLGAVQQPRIEVYNKWDKSIISASELPKGAIPVSALSGEGLDDLQDAIARILREAEKTYKLFVPFSHYHLANELRKLGRVLEETHEEAGTILRLRLTSTAAQRARAQYPDMFGEEV